MLARLSLSLVISFPLSYVCAKRIAEVLNTEPVITDGEKTAKET